MMNSFSPESRTPSGPRQSFPDAQASPAVVSESALGSLLEGRLPENSPPTRSLQATMTGVRPHGERSESRAVSILLVAPEPVAGTVAQALRHTVATRVHVAPQARAGIAAVRREEFDLLVLEENLAAAEPDPVAALFAAAGTAPVLEINFGLCAADRVVRQVRSALQRRAAEEGKARLAVSNSLINELNASLAGLLLESQLAMRQASPEVLPTLQHLVQLASELRQQLRH